MGVASINLTKMGIEFFSQTTARGSLLVQQHHRRDVVEAGQGFFQLAENNQILINEKGTILTFQGHPEKDAQTARLRIGDAIKWYGFEREDDDAWEQLGARLELEHEGQTIWKQILEWAREPIMDFEMQMTRDSSRGSKI